MTLKNLIEGLQILGNYVDLDELIGGADHDIVWVVQADVSPFAAAKLKQLGFHKDTESDAGWSFFC